MTKAAEIARVVAKLEKYNALLVQLTKPKPRVNKTAKKSDKKLKPQSLKSQKVKRGVAPEKLKVRFSSDVKPDE